MASRFPFSAALRARHWRIAAILFGLFGGAALAPSMLRADYKEIGINLSWINYYATQLPFKDLMRQADEWRLGSTTIPFDNPQIDPNGWVKQVNPGQYFSTYLLWDLNPGGTNPNGYAALGNSQLVVHYEGEGTMQLGGGYHVVTNDSVNKRIVLAPNTPLPTQGIEIKITSTNPANYLKNISITKPEYENDLADPWDPTFLSRWQSTDALRFMDWGETNHSPLDQWSDRPPPAYFTQQGRQLPGNQPYVGPGLHPTGASYETMIDLSNRLDKDLWLCVPHNADDNYVAQLATLVSTRLDPGLKVYVEHSNEVWNSIFQQYPDSLAAANSLIAQGQTQLDGGDDYSKVLRYHGLRTKQIGQIFDGVLGADRVMTVLGTQQVNPWVTEQSIGRIPGTNNYWDPGIKDEIDAVAVADYVDISSGLNPTNIDQIFNDLFTKGLPAAKNFDIVQRNLIKSVKPSLDLIAYEGGQSLGYGAADPTLFVAANRDPRMQQVYEQLLADWYDNGGGLFMPYDSTRTFSQYGSWGALEAQGQDPLTAPKYQAILETARELGADFDSDGDVDADDLAQLKNEYDNYAIWDEFGYPLWYHSTSDADGDEDTDGADLLVWQRQLGSSSTTAAASVPEPATMIVMLPGGAMALRLVSVRRSRTR